MSDLNYRLVVDMSTKGTLGSQLERMGPRAQSADSALKRVGESARSIGGDIAGAFTGAVEKVGGLTLALGKLGAIAAGGAIAYGVAGLNNELEKTQISLAAILSAQGVVSTVPRGLMMAGDVMKEMRKDAALLPGEFKDLLSFFKLGLTSGLQSGATVPGFEKMSANAMAAAAAVGVNMDQAAREFAQLLGGHAGTHNVFGSLLGFTGDKAKTFNAESGAKRLKDIETAVKKYEGAIEVFGGSFDAISSTLKDNAKKALGAGTAGLFDRVKIAMADANRWWDQNEDKGIHFAEMVGERLNYAFDFGRSKIEEWGPTLVTFAKNAGVEIEKIWSRVEPILDRLGPKVQEALADPKTFDRLEDTAKLYAGLKVGGALLPALGPLFSGGGGAGTAAAAGAGAAEAGAAAGAMTALGPAAIAAAVGLVAVGGALHDVTDESALFHETAKKSWSDTLDHTSEAWASTRRVV
jgi:hypothetical protein